MNIQEASSDKFRAKFGGDNFATDNMYLEILEWYLDGLRCLFSEDRLTTDTNTDTITTCK